MLGLSTLIYTIPSLAMFAFIFPFTGLSSTTVLIGLVAYSLVILVRNFLAGLQGVPDDVREAARGMGYGPMRLFGRSTCRWPCPRSWPGCGSPRCPRWRW